ncbi:photosystem II biogenesis protein Psp29 [Gloeocapsa sp. PCC 73106]|uniref:photosystem II biogenesis protein Psp29 n=1 Tax=Gloeocapsa sp. PCC 73106 TaxID=102232 RepID=UPI0002AC9525|nr:photosystem II biogenesis protein Psp29 [Gloeocapsa sp. PCC 73106]ELR96844.1 photosystem II biogenesis protein Psp29 [Gloeocapsa sp. PCC 73106]
MEKVRTVSDTKRDFYAHHTRPINSIYRRVVEELIVELHLLSVNQNFRVDPIYCLGVVTSFDRFMQGYRPEEDKASILASLCQAVGGKLEQYRDHANQVLNLAKRLHGVDDLLAWFKHPQPVEGEFALAEAVSAIALNQSFKYSRMFGIGLYTMLGEKNLELLQDKPARDKITAQFAEVLPVSSDKLQKDFELYQANLEKMKQMIIVVEEALEAERKKRAKKSLELETKKDD